MTVRECFQYRSSTVSPVVSLIQQVAVKFVPISNTGDCGPVSNGYSAEHNKNKVADLLFYFIFSSLLIWLLIHIIIIHHFLHDCNEVFFCFFKLFTFQV